MKKMISQLKKFEKEMGWEKTKKKEIVGFLNKDLRELKKSRGSRYKHKIGDLFFEILQLSIRSNVNLEKEFSRHIKTARKKYGA
jgi:NTP pyrophosphatase (non-canonical NTP hydrolase)